MLKLTKDDRQYFCTVAYSHSGKDYVVFRLEGPSDLLELGRSDGAQFMVINGLNYNRSVWAHLTENHFVISKGALPSMD